LLLNCMQMIVENAQGQALVQHVQIVVNVNIVMLMAENVGCVSNN
jgi:hypothetical protein